MKKILRHFSFLAPHRAHAFNLVDVYTPPSRMEISSLFSVRFLGFPASSHLTNSLIKITRETMSSDSLKSL